MDIYKDIVDVHYDEREETSKVGSFKESHGTEPQIVQENAMKKKPRCSTDKVARPVRMEKRYTIIFL